MKLFLTGATGFIGGHAARALADRGHELTCVVRPSASPIRLQPLRSLPSTAIIPAEWTELQPWEEMVRGHDVVLNAVGIIRERGSAAFEEVHFRTPAALFRAAAAAGVRKVVQLSALGADESAVTPYHLTKRAADRFVAGLGIPYVVLRPSFVYGPGDHSVSFFARLAALPITPVPGDGEYRVQPAHVDDVVRALVMAVERDDLSGLTLDMGGANALTFKEMLDVLARSQGKSAGARKLHIPWSLMELAAWLTDMLGGRGPINRDELTMLRRGSTADNQAFVQAFGFTPRPFAPTHPRPRHSPSSGSA